MRFTVILADDEPQILDGIYHSMNWEQLGFNVIATALNGKELLELTETLRPDLIISDIKMPFMDGIEVAKILHEKMMHIKIVLFSGWDDFEYAQLAIRYGVSEYVLKPIDFEEMGSLLEKLNKELEKEFKQHRNRERLEEIYEKSLPLLQEQFMVQLVKGVLNSDQITRQLRSLSITLDSEWFNIVLIKVAEENDNYLSQVSVMESVSEMLDKVCRFISFRYLDKLVYLLMISELSEMPTIQRSLNEAAHISKHYSQISFSCGIGSACESLAQLPSSFAQATEALEYSVVSTEESVTLYQDIELYENNVCTSISTEELEMAIKLGNKEKIQYEVKKLISQLEENHYNFNAYQSAILEIIFSISGIFRQYHMMDDEIFADAKRMTMKVLSLETGEQLNSWLLNYCNYTSYAIHLRKVDRNSLLAQKAIAYVEQHYNEADLSVETVCDYLHVSATHFSNLFRRETGLSFLAFLTKKRIEEAVRLLKTTDYKSRVIGEMVGYPEPNYFSYVFKKNMNVSPANFRKEKASENHYEENI